MGLDQSKIAQAEAEISWLGARLREPSSYNAMSMVLAALHISGITPEALHVWSAMGIAIGGLIGFYLPEGRKAAAAIAAMFMLAAAVSGDARAADMQLGALNAMPVKAPPAVNLQYPYNGSGMYFGIGSLASQTNPTIDGTTATNLQAFGGSVGGVVGYRVGNGNIAFAIEGEALWNNMGGASQCTTATCSINSRFTAIERAKAIVPLTMLTSLFPSLNLPSVPVLPSLPNISATSQHTYAFFGLKEDDVSAAAGLAAGRAWQFSPGGGVGLEVQASNGTVIDIWAGYFNPSSGFAIGAPPTVTQGRQYMAGLSWLF